MNYYALIKTNFMNNNIAKHNILNEKQNKNFINIMIISLKKFKNVLAIGKKFSRKYIKYK